MHFPPQSGPTQHTRWEILTPTLGRQVTALHDHDMPVIEEAFQVGTCHGFAVG
jgi:hypothetical protein